MYPADVLHFSGGAMRGYPLRTMLMWLAIAIGTASVIILTGLGEGARRYVNDQFSSLGTHLLVVLPGRTETTGGPPPLLGATPRNLTIDDALELERSTAIERVAPISVGSAPVSWRERKREVTVVGSTADFYPIRHLQLGQGRFLPPGDPHRGAGVVVLGYQVKQELFGNRHALGRWIRIGDRRFRVIGVLAEQGRSLGLDLADVVIIPVASAQALFNTETLFRVLVQAVSREAIPKAEKAVRAIIRARHEGEEDVTVITQDAMLSTFDRILTALTLTVGGIAAISLVVAGILIMNVMLVAVSQRTTEIGILKALGATAAQIQWLFLVEAALLSLVGALVGALLGLGGVWVLGRVFPDFPVAAPLWALIAAVIVSVLAGVGFGVMPARKASRLDPVQALAGK